MKSTSSTSTLSTWCLISLQSPSDLLAGADSEDPSSARRLLIPHLWWSCLHSPLQRNHLREYVVWYLFTRAIIYAFMYFCARVYIYTIYTLPFRSDKKYVPPLYAICVFLDFLFVQKYYPTVLNPFIWFLLLFMILIFPRSESLLCCVLAQARVS